MVIFFPELQYAVAALGNTAVTSNAVEETLVFALIDEKMKIPKKERYDWNKKNLKYQTDKLAYLSNATAEIYPNLPSPRLIHSLPLSAYTGTYYHPSYRNFTLSESTSTSGTLVGNRTDVTWTMGFAFEHVSGEYFIAKIDSLVSPGGTFMEAAPAGFKLGIDGKVSSVGIGLESQMGNKERICFQKIAD